MVLVLFFSLFFGMLNASDKIEITSHIMKSGKVFTIISKPHFAGVKIEIKTRGFMLNKSFFINADSLEYVFIQDLNNDGYEEIYLLLKRHKNTRVYTDIEGLSEYGKLIARKINVLQPKEANLFRSNKFVLNNDVLFNIAVIDGKKYKYKYKLIKDKTNFALMPSEPIVINKHKDKK